MMPFHSFDNIIGRIYSNHPTTNNTRTVCVACIPANINEEKLADLFSHNGEIDDIKVVRDPLTKKSKRHAYIVFKHTDGANRALNMDGMELDQNSITVRLVPDSVKLGVHRRSGSRTTHASRIRARSRSPVIRRSFSSESLLDNPASLMIEGISPATEEIHISNFMSNFGCVLSVKVFAAECCARVTFSSAYEAHLAAKQANHHIGSNGQLITVKVLGKPPKEIHYNL